MGCIFAILDVRMELTLRAALGVEISLNGPSAHFLVGDAILGCDVLLGLIDYRIRRIGRLS